MKFFVNKNNKKGGKLISGWGKTNSVNVEIVNPKSIQEIRNLLINAKPRSIIARGSGRSYGDAAQNKEGKIINWFSSMTSPTSEGLLKQVEQALFN